MLVFGTGLVIRMRRIHVFPESMVHPVERDIDEVEVVHRRAARSANDFDCLRLISKI